MNQESMVCQNCKDQFIIEPEDFAFYEKMRVPPPTFCPECRLQRRFAWRNERALYKRKCDLTGKDIISIYASDAPYKVYDVREWFSDKWDAMQYGRDYDFSRPFFAQFADLMREVPWMSVIIDYPTLVNSDYTNYVGHLKNCYLVTDADLNENCAYTSSVSNTKDSFDALIGGELELSYECTNCRRCQKTYFSEDCEDCFEVSFSKNLVGCSYCIGCVNLRKKQYHIFNQPYSKEEYFHKIAEMGLDSYRGIKDMREQAHAFWLQFPYKFLHERHNTNVSGDYVYYSKNATYCNQVTGVEDSKYCQFIGLKPARDCYDYTEWGNNATLLYECLTVGEGASTVKFSNLCWPNARNIEYSMQCQKSSDLFGCIGVKNTQFCIFNKQYPESEYHTLRGRMIAHMNEMPYTDRRGRVYRYGEFFPIEISPFAYNETTAQHFFPLTKEEALAQGHAWRDAVSRGASATRMARDLPGKIADVSDSILQDIIGCLHGGTCNDSCTLRFRLIPSELAFYRSQNLPLPRVCPNCRHAERIRRRNPMKFWQRRCGCAGVASGNDIYRNQANHFHGAAPCSNEFVTSYAPDRPEIIYCEQCYNAEVA